MEYLDERGEGATRRVVGQLRKDEPALYNRFLGERYLRDTMVDTTAGHDAAIDFPTLVRELKGRADAVTEIQFPDGSRTASARPARPACRGSHAPARSVPHSRRRAPAGRRRASSVPRPRGSGAAR